MGVLLMWNKPTADAVYENTEIYKSSSQTGTYTLLDTVTLTDTTYYDKSGSNTSWYKIRFITTAAGGTASEYSDPIQGDLKILYCEPDDVMRIAGFIESTLPESITINDLYQWIYECSGNIDKLTKTVYGREETFEEILSSRYMRSNGTIQLREHRKISDLVVQFRTNIAPPLSYQTKREGYDYEYEPESAKIHLFTLPLTGSPYSFNNLKFTGNFGTTEIPDSIKQLTAIFTAIRIFVHITGGSYNDATSYSIGEFSESFGEPYTNLRASIERLEVEAKRISDQCGVPLKMIDMRIE